MNRKIAALLAAALLCLSSVSCLAWGEDPLCFGDQPLYASYDDQDHLQINVIKVDQSPKLVYFVCDIQVSSPQVLSTVFHNDRVFEAETDKQRQSRMEKTAILETIAENHQAVLAINCDFCGSHENGIIIRNGVLCRAKTTKKLDMLIIDQNGDFSLHYDRTGEDPKAFAQELLDRGVWQTIEFGPALVENGAALPLDNKTHVISTRSSQLEPRTGIGQVGPLHYVIIVAEGRRDGYSEGLSLQNFQKLFLEYGVQTAINLDGGGSTKIWFYNQVINRPTSPSRQVSDALMFK